MASSPPSVTPTSEEQAARQLDFDRLHRRRERLLRALGPTRGRVLRKQRGLSTELDGIDHALDRLAVEATR